MWVWVGAGSRKKKGGEPALGGLVESGLHVQKDWCRTGTVSREELERSTCDGKCQVGTKADPSLGLRRKAQICGTRCSWSVSDVPYSASFLAFLFSPILYLLTICQITD